MRRGNDLTRPDHRAPAFELDPDPHLVSPILAEGLAFWNEVRAAPALPLRADIDPTTLPRRLLPHILMVDVERGAGVRFRWRLIGTHITEALGRDATGQYFDELYDAALLDLSSKPATWVIEHRRPPRSVGTGRFAAKDFLTFECLLLPLSNDGETVDIILMVAVYPT